MAGKNLISLNGIAETLLITLYIRALESQRPDALIKDDLAVTIVNQMRTQFSRFEHIIMDEYDKTVIILRNREYDRLVQDFLTRHSEAIVVHIGCGFDTRFKRVDNGEVEWYDLDMPDVIELRKRLIGGEEARYHMIGCSMLDNAWIDHVGVHHSRPFLFLAEGVFMYFKEAQVKSFIRTLQEHFLNTEIIFDAFSPLLVRANNFRFRVSRTKITARYQWGLKDGRDLEKWGGDIKLLDVWFPFDDPEPRLARLWWIRHIPFLARVMGIFHYQLGKPARPHHIPGEIFSY